MSGMISPIASCAWQDLVHPTNTAVAYTPTMPLKKGHLAILMASGMPPHLGLEAGVGTLHLTSYTNDRLVIRLDF